MNTHLRQIELRDPAVRAAQAKLVAGERLSQEDGVRLFDASVMDLGRLADAFARDRHGDRVYFTVNRQLNPTNVCVLSCRFCDYAKKPGDAGAYTMTEADVKAHVDQEISEIHIVGGLHNKWRFDDYLNVIRWVKEVKPDLQVKAYTAVEIDFFCRLTKQPAEWVLAELRQAGLDALPGGGAEVFSERVRREIFHQKIGGRRWLEIHEIAHRMGIPSNATLLYGHVETRAERVQHMILLRDLETRAPGFFAFIPLAFQPGTTGLVRRQASAIEDLKTIAISRLVFDNVPHVKSYWVMLGQDTAGIALDFGASDLDGTIGVEKIAHAALARSPIGMAEESMVQTIREAGKRPVQRDALYNTIKEYPLAEPPADPRAGHTAGVAGAAHTRDRFTARRGALTMAHAHGKGFVDLVDRARKNVREMSIEEYRRRVAAGERLVLVDVREDLEWAEGRIPGAIHIGKGVLERDIEEQLPDPETPIVFQCRGGYRSVLAAESVARMGYTRAWSLAEGYRGWVERGLPVEKD